MPGIEDLRRLMQSMALLDAILCPDWSSRYYSFNQNWASGEQLGSMRDGCGNELFAHFGRGGCWIKGFVHDCEMALPGQRGRETVGAILAGVPVAFAGCMEEPAFSVGDVTFCIWREPADAVWRRSPVEFPSRDSDPDGSEQLLSAYDGLPETYAAWASDSYGEELDAEAVAAVYRHEPLTPALVKRLNPELGLRDLAEDLSEIGYPLAGKA